MSRVLGVRAWEVGARDQEGVWCEEGFPLRCGHGAKGCGCEEFFPLSVTLGGGGGGGQGVCGPGGKGVCSEEVFHMEAVLGRSKPQVLGPKPESLGPKPKSLSQHLWSHGGRAQ